LTALHPILENHAYLQDFKWYGAIANAKFTPLYPISFALSYQNLSSAHFSFTAAISSILGPTTYKQAAKHQCLSTW